MPSSLSQLGQLYKQVTVGVEAPDMMVVASDSGPLVITKEHSYLVDDNGDYVESVSQEWAAAQAAKQLRIR